jgi:hypothetical protein
MRVGDRKAELVLGTRVGEIDQFQSAVGIEIDEVAIGGEYEARAKTPMPRSTSPRIRRSFCSNTA